MTRQVKIIVEKHAEALNDVKSAIRFHIETFGDEVLPATGWLRTTLGRGWTPMDADKGKCGASSRTVGGSGIPDEVGTYYTDVVKRVEKVVDKVDNPRPGDVPIRDKNG